MATIILHIELFERENMEILIGEERVMELLRQVTENQKKLIELQTQMIQKIKKEKRRREQDKKWLRREYDERWEVEGQRKRIDDK